MKKQEDNNKINTEYKQDSMGTRAIPEVDKAVKKSSEKPSKHDDN